MMTMVLTCSKAAVLAMSQSSEHDSDLYSLPPTNIRVLQNSMGLRRGLHIRP